MPPSGGWLKGFPLDFKVVGIGNLKKSFTLYTQSIGNSDVVIKVHLCQCLVGENLTKLMFDLEPNCQDLIHFSIS